MPDDALLAEIIALVPELGGRERTIAALGGGLTNRNYRVDCAGESYVVRISDNDSGLLAIDRDNEHVNSRAAAEAGVGADVVAYLPDLGALVIGFIEGETQSVELIQRGDRLAEIAAACRTLHEGPSFSGGFDMFAIQSRYRALVGERHFRLPARYDEFEPKVREIERAMVARREPTRPCNNDLLAENFIWTGDRFRLIDYEYSGQNDPMFELGNIWSESNLSLHQLDQLVTHYYARRRQSRIARARLWGLMSKYGWTLWASIQDGVSPIDFDFWGWGMEKYERAIAEFDGPDLPRLLEQLQLSD